MQLEAPPALIVAGAALRRATPEDSEVRYATPDRQRYAVDGNHYRPDIDGLRGIAVLLVVAYHFGVWPVHGGFIGVDVFFVISGFLITGIITRELEAGMFSLSEFYRRRVRRILPALAVVLATTAAVSLLFQFPGETMAMALSLAAAMTFVSNFYFLSQAEYFAGSAYSMPLLHTWSLAIEEQFYLLFPLLMLSLARWGGPWWRGARALLLAIAVASFVTAVILVAGYQEAGFYLIFSRAWELAAGALLAMGLLPEKLPRWLAEVIGLVGLALILAAALQFHAGMRFPGLLALAPVGGAVCLIYAGSYRRSLVARCLASPPLRLTGLISYSLYLWHWPLIVFFVAATGHHPEGVGTAMLVAGAILLAVLTWRFVEQPMRETGSLTSRRPWAVFATTAAAAAAFLMVVLEANGWPGRYTAEQVRLAAFIDYDDAGLYRRGQCFIDSHLQRASAFDKRRCLARDARRPNVLIIGDSHAAHLWKAMVQTFPQYHFLQATASGCKPLIDGKGEAVCRQIMTDTLKHFVPEAGLAGIIVAARWDMSDRDPLVQTVRDLMRSADNIYVFGPIMTYASPLPRLLALAETKGPQVIDAAREPYPVQVDVSLAQVMADSGARYVSYFHLLCSEPAGCQTLTEDRVPLQWDYGHLTQEGGIAFATALRKHGAFP